jgi:hypothetical protein
MNSLILISPSKGEAFNQFFLVKSLENSKIWIGSASRAELVIETNLQEYDFYELKNMTFMSSDNEFMN